MTGAIAGLHTTICYRPHRMRKLFRSRSATKEKVNAALGALADVLNAIERQAGPSTASPIGPRTSSGKMTAVPAGGVPESREFYPGRGGRHVQCADAVDFNRHTVDVDLDCGNCEEFPGPHRGHRENRDRDRSCRTGIVGAAATHLDQTLRLEVAPVHFAGSLILDPAGHYSTNDFPRTCPADRIVNAAKPAKFTTKSTGGNMTRPRAADDFAVIRARIHELQCERLTHVRAADDFPAISARIEELRPERVQVSARSKRRTA